MSIIFLTLYISICLILVLFFVKGIELKFQQNERENIRRKIDKGMDYLSFKLLNNLKLLNKNKNFLIISSFSFVYNRFLNFYLLVRTKIDNFNFLIRKGRGGSRFSKKGSRKKSSKFFKNIEKTKIF